MGVKTDKRSGIKANASQPNGYDTQTAQWSNRMTNHKKNNSSGMSRRAFVRSLVGGIPIAALGLAACASSKDDSAQTAGGTDNAVPSPTEADGASKFAGVTLQVWSGATIAPPAKSAGERWAALTGGTVVVTPVPYAERSLKFAGLITAQDPSIDLLYASGSFVGRLGTKLYENLSSPDLGVDTSIYVPATLPVLSSGESLCGLPIHSEMNIYIYNKTMFKAAGLDPDSPPAKWSDLYAAASQLAKGDRYGCTIPWTTSIGTGGYYLLFLNSIKGAKLLSDDRTQVLFDGDAGLLAFTLIEEGMRAGFFTPDLGQDFEDYATGKLFNEGGTASMINFAELWGYAVGKSPTDFPTKLKPEEVGAAVVPLVDTGNSGSINGFEGLGINKFSQQKAAALHYLRFVTGPEFQLEMNLGGTLPSSNTQILENPEVKAGYAVGPVLAKQGKGNLDRYSAPYNWDPPISEALRKLYDGSIDAKQAHTAVVEGVQKIVMDYLAA